MNKINTGTNFSPCSHFNGCLNGGKTFLEELASLSHLARVGSACESLCVRVEGRCSQSVSGKFTGS